MKRLQLLLTLFLLMNGLVLAQSNNDKARAYFLEAKSSFETGSYENAIEFSTKAEKLLGSTNPVILNLKVKAYYNLGQYDNAKTALNQFSKVSSNADAELVDETLSYIIKIDDAKKEEKANIEKERRAEIERKETARLEEAELETQKKEELANFKKWNVEFKEKYNIETDNFLASGVNGNIGLVSKNGDVIIPFEFSSRSFSQFSGTLFELQGTGKQSYYLLDVKTGIFILNDVHDINELKNGFSIVMIKKMEGFGYILINSNGTVITKREYDELDDFKEGLACFGIKTGQRDYDGDIFKRGFIDIMGNEVIPPTYYFVDDFSEGLAMAKYSKDGNRGFINKKGETVIPFIYGKAYPFKNGRASVSKSAKYKAKMHYINTFGKKL